MFSICQKVYTASEQIMVDINKTFLETTNLFWNCLNFFIYIMPEIRCLKNKIGNKAIPQSNLILLKNLSNWQYIENKHDEVIIKQLILD